MGIKRHIYKFIEEKFLSGCSDYNDLEVRKSCRSKKQAREMFKANNIPCAEGEIFFNPYRAYKFVEKHGFPVVLKPNVGGFSRGSYFPITNYKDFWKAMFLVKLRWPTSVVETYLLGKNYRVVVTNDSVDLVMQRYPAFVVGDGNKTISELIDDENKIRNDMDLGPTIKNIKKSNAIKNHIKKQGFNFDSVLDKDINLELYHRVSLAPGGVLENIELNEVTDKNKEIFKKVLKLFGANLFGVDVIMEKGVHIDYDKQKTIFLEVNSRPYLKMHTKPRYGSVPDLNPLYTKLDNLVIKDRGIY